LQVPLGYDTWRRFAEVVERARQACESAGGRTAQHFAATGNVITAGHGAQLERADWFLTRYAFWRRVRQKCKREGVSVRATILQLLQRWLSDS
jgi:hypothetical protein